MRQPKARWHGRYWFVGGVVLAAACSAPPGVPGPALTTSALPGIPGAGRIVQPPVTPAPGGGPTSYPEGTVFLKGNIEVAIGSGGTFTPSHVYLRPGATTTFVNRDSVAHTVSGFNGATDSSGGIPPGGRYTKSWAHPGTWTFRDPTVPNSGVFTVTDVPTAGE